MNTPPHILLVNIEADISADLEQALKAKFGNDCRWSSYSRPKIKSYPRMRPVKRSGIPEFQVVVIDVGHGIGNLDDMDVIDMPIIPEWLEADLLNSVREACVIVLTPQKVLMGVSANFGAISRNRPHPLEFVVREPLQWTPGVAPADEIHRCWTGRTATGSSFFDRSRKLFTMFPQG
jgi:hypothetical protein